MIFNNKYDRGKKNRKVKVANMDNKLFWDMISSYKLYIAPKTNKNKKYAMDTNTISDKLTMLGIDHEIKR